MGVTQKERDWQGKAVPADEPPETVIKVWAIDPGVIGYDETWVREYARAVEVAGEILAELMDGVLEEDAETEGVTITVKLRGTTAGEYAESCEQEP